MISEIGTQKGPLEDSASVLSAFRESQLAVRAHEAAQIGWAATFASFHEVDDWRQAASLDDTVPGGEGELLLGGDGCPWISEFAVVEFAAATGRSTQSGRAFLAQSMELVHRLPRTWAHVRAGKVDGWRARRIAGATVILPREGAAWVDAKVATRANKIGVRALDRLIEEAIATFDPEATAEREAEAVSDLHVRIEHVPDHHGLGATTRVDAVMDALDALDLDAALNDIADQLAALEGASESKEARRSRALGMLARGEVRFGTPNATAPDSPAVHITPREISLVVRVAEGDTVAHIHSLTGQDLGMVTIDRLRTWCGHSHVTVKPVLDLTTEAVSSGRFPSQSVRDQVIETCRTCVFPYCGRPAEACDQDHIDPYECGGPPGQTNTGNLAALCRLHHRVKTHSRWRYRQTAPGTFIWTSPEDYQYLRTPEGTIDLRQPA